MRRKRYQKGSVRSRKHGKTKVWVGQWWEDGRKRKSKRCWAAAPADGKERSQRSVVMACDSQTH